MKRAGHNVHGDMVYQRLSLVSHLSILENLLLGSPDTPHLPFNEVNRIKAASTIAKLGLTSGIDQLVLNLSASERQLVEVAKLLWRSAKVLILDEPTSHLAPHESDEVLTRLRALSTSEACTILLVTHKIEEVLRFADKVTVLRAGHVVGSENIHSLRREDLAKLMIGEIKSSGATDSSKPPAVGERLLSLRSIALAS